MERVDMWIDGFYVPTRDYTAKYKFNHNSKDYWKLITILRDNKPDGVSNIRIYDTKEQMILVGEHLAEKQGYIKCYIFVVFDFEIPKHYGARRWLRERFEIEPDVCWYHYYQLLDKNPLEIFEDEL